MITARASKWASGHIPLRTMSVLPPRPLLSVTFDDVIASAAHEGAQILAGAGVRGTFYVAGGLTDTVEEGHRTHQVADLRALHEAGHQIACHGWSHQRLSSLTSAQIRDELDRNAAFLAQITGTGADTAELDLAYPLGDHSWRTKTVARRLRSSLRVTGGGLHQGRTDVDCLGSYRLYGDGAVDAQWERFLASLVTARGWGIVNSHAVTADPGPYGVDPATLRRFLARALALGIEIVPVRDAIESFSGGRR